MISRLELQQGTTATHLLESQGKNDQQAPIVAMHWSHSHPEVSRTGLISRLRLLQGITATHKLKS